MRLLVRAAFERITRNEHAQFCTQRVKGAFCGEFCREFCPVICGKFCGEFCGKFCGEFAGVICGAFSVRFCNVSTRTRAVCVGFFTRRVKTAGKHHYSAVQLHAVSA